MGGAAPGSVAAMTSEPTAPPSDADADAVPATLEEAARAELECLWHDLDQAIAAPFAAEWSIACENISDRIRALTVFLGPCRWEAVPVTVLLNGHYERLHAEWGVPAPVDWTRVPHPYAPGKWRVSGEVPADPGGV